MTIDQPTATIIAAGIVASGQVIVELIKSKAPKSPNTTSDKKNTPAFPRGGVWPSVVILLFSVLMLYRSFVGIAPYWKSQVPATSAQVVSIVTYGAAILVFAAIGGWNASAIWHTMRRRR